MITKDSVDDNISSNQTVILQSPEATLTIMIITTTIIIIIATKIRAINSIDFTKIGHHLVLHSKSAHMEYSCHVWAGAPTPWNF